MAVIGERWTATDPAGSVLHLIHDWLWEQEEGVWSPNALGLMSAQRLDFFILHAGFERALEEAGLPDPSYRLDEAIAFVDAIGATDHFLLYRDFAGLIAETFSIQLDEVARTNFLLILEPGGENVHRFRRQASPLMARASALEEKQPLSVALFEAASLWPDLRKVTADEFRRLLDRQ